MPEAVDGESLLPFLKRPDRPSEEAAAFGYWRSQEDWGKTVRIGRYRLTRWANDEGKRAQVELYDHRVDPNETENVADQHPAVVRRLMRRLKMDDQRVKQASSDQ